MTTFTTLEHRLFHSLRFVRVICSHWTQIQIKSEVIRLSLINYIVQVKMSSWEKSFTSYPGTRDCINNRIQLQVGKVRPVWKFLKPAFFLAASRGRIRRQPEFLLSINSVYNTGCLNQKINQSIKSSYKLLLLRADHCRLNKVEMCWNGGEIQVWHAALEDQRAPLR